MSPPDAIGTEDNDLSIDLAVYVTIETQPQHGIFDGIAAKFDLYT
jgi:hypothetical protein